MTLETFFEKFALFADAPGAVGKLRELVLQLAVRGRLAEANPCDEPVDTFLHRIWRDSNDPRCKLDSGEVLKPFEIPLHWRWVRLAEVSIFAIGKTPPRKELAYWQPGIHPWASIADMKQYGTLSSTKESVSQLAAHEVFHGRFASRDSILMSFKLTIGKVARAGLDCFHNEAIISLAPPEPALDRYLFRLLPIFARFQTSNAAIKGNTLNKALLTSLPIALPPLAEQKRIVAKVDELMALCDRLEAQQRERATRHAALARAALARFDADPTPANLDTLFHPSFAIDPANLRRSILSLAVRGKLVPQNPNDRSAEVLIATVKTGLPNKKSQNPFLQDIEPTITNESEYSLPSGWCWLPLGHLGVWATGFGFPTQYQGETGKEFMFCKVSDMNLPGNEIQIRSTKNSIDATVMQKIRARANPPGTVVFPKIGGAIATNKRRLVIEPTIIDNNCSGIQPIGLTNEHWLLLLLRSLDLTKYQSGTSVPAVSQSALDPIRIGLPPLPEQRRIVAKVDELMARVDKLESDLAAARGTAARLLDAAVAELTAPAARTHDGPDAHHAAGSAALRDAAAVAAP